MANFMHEVQFYVTYWRSQFSGRNSQAIGPRLSAIFTSFYLLLFVLFISFNDAKIVIIFELNKFFA